MNLKEIKDLIEFISEKGFAEFEIKHAGFPSSDPPISGVPPGNSIAERSGICTPPLLAAPDAAAGKSKQRRTNELVAGPPEGARAVGRESHVQSEPGLHVINSPIVGTFFAHPRRKLIPFVTIGSQVEPDTVVCIIEAMKLMNEIQAEIGGESRKSTSRMDNRSSTGSRCLEYGLRFSIVAWLL